MMYVYIYIFICSMHIRTFFCILWLFIYVIAGKAMICNCKKKHGCFGILLRSAIPPVMCSYSIDKVVADASDRDHKADKRATWQSPSQLTWCVSSAEMKPLDTVWTLSRVLIACRKAQTPILRTSQLVMKESYKSSEKHVANMWQQTSTKVTKQWWQHVQHVSHHPYVWIFHTT